MRILLVQPAPPKANVGLSHSSLSRTEPLALETVAAQLGSEHEIMLLDTRLEEKNALERTEPQMMGS